MPNSEFDRSSRVEVFRVLDELLPTPEARRAFAELAARSIEAVHRLEPRGWGITVQPHRVSLNLGAVAFLGVTNDEAWVLVLDDGEASSADLDAKVYTGVKSFPGSRWLGVPAPRFPELAQRARTSIDRLLERVIQKASRCPYRESHTPAAVDYIAELVDRLLPQLVMPDAKDGSGPGFPDLIEEFLAAYWPTEECRRSMALYASSRVQARKNLDRALELLRSGPESQFLEAVLDGLLPHSWNERNTQAGKWIAVAPTGMKDIAGALEGSGTITVEQWPAITRAIVHFIQDSTSAPDRIESTSADFIRAVPKGFQAGVLSPILGALAPESFVTVNRKSLAVLAKLGGPRFTSQLEDYPEANRAVRGLLEENAELFERPEFEEHRVEDVFDHFCHWMEAVRTKVDPANIVPIARPQVWKVAPEENGTLWPKWSSEGHASIGWGDLGDVGGLTEDEFEERREEAAKSKPVYAKEGPRQVRKFASLPIGTILVANRGTRQVLGIGRVTGPYEHVPGDYHAHRLPVDWFDRTLREVDQPGWRRTMIELDEDFLESLGVSPNGSDGAAPWLSARAFELFGRLREFPSKETYQASKAEFQGEIETPFRELFRRLRTRLSGRILAACETERNVLARFLKNDYGRGGAHESFWGAFYPRDGQRIGDAQLAVFANADRVSFGFYLPDPNPERRHLFHLRLLSDEAELARTVPDFVRGHPILFGEVSPPYSSERPEGRTGRGTLSDVIRERGLSKALIVLDREEVLRTPRRELEGLIAATIEAVFPLFLRAIDKASPETSDADVDSEAKALVSVTASDSISKRNPPYSLDDLARESSLSLDLLREWVRALDRKGQAIIYGPPGTGKTFLAERIAKHLVADTDGLIETIQFHPAYGYEDFMQGIRPRTLNGSVTYDLVDGNFVDFCSKAATRSGPSVLIVDEINRANLPRVFGELMFLLEYRDKDIRLASGVRFRVPPQVRLLGTMNTADRSIALVDHALRRRFAFLKLEPQFEVLRRRHQASQFPIDRWITLLERVNARIGDPNHSVGISFFLRDDLADHIESIWRHEIFPYLEEYFFDDDQAVAEFSWERIVEVHG